MNTQDDGTHAEAALRWQLRALRQEREPGTDLWPGIAARLAEARPSVGVPPPARGTRRMLPWAMVASLLLAVGVVWQMIPGASPGNPGGSRLIRQQAVSMSQEYEGAIARLQQAATHPEMHGAFVELDRSAAQILTAIDRDPEATFLLEKLRRTYARRLQLTQRALMT